MSEHYGRSHERSGCADRPFHTGTDTIKPGWISIMAEKSIVFTCANPVPEIYPDVAIAAGAYIVATGRGDFPNQINNSCGFPGILKGALISQASKITDRMAIGQHMPWQIMPKTGVSIPGTSFLPWMKQESFPSRLPKLPARLWRMESPDVPFRTKKRLKRPKMTSKLPEPQPRI